MYENILSLEKQIKEKIREIFEFLRQNELTIEFYPDQKECKMPTLKKNTPASFCITVFTNKKTPILGVYYDSPEKGALPIATPLTTCWKRKDLPLAIRYILPPLSLLEIFPPKKILSLLDCLFSGLKEYLIELDNKLGENSNHSM